MGMPAVNLSHTPSIYYALGYFISSCILVAINRRRLSFKKWLSVFLLYYFCLSGFMYPTDGVDIWEPSFAANLANKRAEGKHYNVAISHSVKKLVHLIFALQTTGKTF